MKLSQRGFEPSFFLASAKVMAPAIQSVRVDCVGALTLRLKLSRDGRETVHNIKLCLSQAWREATQSHKVDH